MANTLLRSGDIKDFKMLGHDGKAAYLVASQIREMFRVKLGRQYSDCLAIPQRNMILSRGLQLVKMNKSLH